MLIDGITLTPGSNVANLKVADYSTFPTNPFEGQTIELTATVGGSTPGQYTYRAGKWQAVGGSGGGTVDTSSLLTKTDAATMYATKDSVNSLATQSSLTSLSEVVSGKASQEALNAVATSVSGKASVASVNSVLETLALKANTSALSDYIKTTAADKKYAAAGSTGLSKTEADTLYASKASESVVIGSSTPGQPSANTRLLTYVGPNGYTATIRAAGSGCKAVASVAPSNTFMLTMFKNGAQVGTITFSAGSKTASFSCNAISLAPSDVFHISTGNTIDSSISDVAITIIAPVSFA